MKSANFNKDRRSAESPSAYYGLKDRRKSYYHGKYNREVMSVIVLLALVMVYILRQGV